MAKELFFSFLFFPPTLLEEDRRRAGLPSPPLSIFFPRPAEEAVDSGSLSPPRSKK